MSDNVTGYGVPLTTAQRVAKYGARTRPNIEGKLPLFELDESLDPTYRETVLLGYEAIDSRARKVLSDARSWVYFQGTAAAAILLVWALFVFATFALNMAVLWTVIAAIVVVVAFPYRRIELRKHAALVEEANEMLKPFVDSGKARYI